VTTTGPPAHAWDWFARQKLLWREVRTRLGAATGPAAARYGTVDARADVIALRRVDYDHDPVVRRTVDAVVAEVALLGRTDRRFDELEVASAPRGMRWWWTALTGEDLERPRPRPPLARREQPPSQMTLDDVHLGYGD
jgi:hypothetical protein